MGRPSPPTAAQPTTRSGPPRSTATSPLRRHDNGIEHTVMNWEYLLLTARKQP